MSYPPYQPPQPGSPQEPGYAPPVHPGGMQPGSAPPAGWYGYPPANPKAGTTNSLAVVSLIFGILGGILLSVIFGIIALVQIPKNQQNGKNLAIAGLALSAAWLVIIFLLILADSV